MDDERPPICPACGVTAVPAALGSRRQPDGDWVCLECEETDGLDPEGGLAGTVRLDMEHGWDAP